MYACDTDSLLDFFPKETGFMCFHVKSAVNAKALTLTHVVLLLLIPFSCFHCLSNQVVKSIKKGA